MYASRLAPQLGVGLPLQVISFYYAPEILLEELSFTSHRKFTTEIGGPHRPKYEKVKMPSLWLQSIPVSRLHVEYHSCS